MMLASWIIMIGMEAFLLYAFIHVVTHTHPRDGAGIMLGAYLLAILVLWTFFLKLFLTEVI